MISQGTGSIQSIKNLKVESASIKCKKIFHTEFAALYVLIEKKGIFPSGIYIFTKKNTKYKLIKPPCHEKNYTNNLRSFNSYKHECTTRERNNWLHKLVK